MTDETTVCAELVKQTRLLREVKDELKMIRMFFTSPAYVVCFDEDNKEALKELNKELCKPNRPGRIIPLSNEAFELYTTMLPCPPRSP